jgi:hypothetical protein
MAASQSFLSVRDFRPPIPSFFFTGRRLDIHDSLLTLLTCNLVSKISDLSSLIVNPVSQLSILLPLSQKLFPQYN